jgi:hypothetical protein
MSPSSLRNLIRLSFVVMLSIAGGAMGIRTNAFAAPIAGPQALKNLIHRSQADSFTHISCASDQFNKCLQYCVDSHRRLQGRDDLAGCKRYCRDNASTQNGCPR